MKEVFYRQLGLLRNDVIYTRKCNIVDCYELHVAGSKTSSRDEFPNNGCVKISEPLTSWSGFCCSFGFETNWLSVDTYAHVCMVVQ